MSYTKRQIVNSALSEIGLAEYTFDVLPEQSQEALRRLDSMLAEWNGRGILLSYPVPTNPNSSTLDQDSGIPDHAWEAVITNLALRIAPSYGKSASPHTMATARHSLNTVMAKSAMPREMMITDIPSGAGHKNIDQPFIENESDVIERHEPEITFR